MTESLHHLHLFFVIDSAKELALFDHVQITFLQPDAAHDANETPQMEDALASPHHQFFRGDPFGTC